MAKCLVLAIVLSSVTSCTNIGKGPSKKLVSIAANSNVDLFSLETGDLIHFDDSLRRFTYGDVVFYEIPYTYTISNLNAKNDMLHEEELSSQIKYRYFIYEKGSQFGLRFDSLTHADGARFSVDSFMKATIRNPKFKLRAIDSLINSYWNKDTLIEKYILKQKEQVNEYDTSYFYYVNTFKSGYSLSDSLDQAKGKQLIKVRYIINPISKGFNGIDIPRRELLFSYRTIMPEDSDKIISLIKRLETNK